MQAHDLSEHVHHEDEHAHNRVGERRTKWVIAITAVMMVGELIVGWWTGSVALTADGWHMGTHVGALGLTLVAYWYARTRAGHDRFSFGTGKIYALAGYTSGVLLTIVALVMAYEGIHNLITHPPVDYRDSLPVAALGFVVNLISTALLSRGQHYGHGHGHHGHGHHGHGHDHAHRPAPVPGTLDFNLRAAYIHIFADAMTSLLAIAALSLGWWAGVWYLDPLMGLIGGAVIIWWAGSLCLQAARQLLDVVSSPHHERIVRERLESIDDVRVADLHVWELGPGRRSCIVSVVTARPREVSDYRDAVLSALEVSHLTIEIHRCGLAHGEPAHHGHDH
ncbi:MAG TPA: CDF family Co(II)/Ni(II) efflux transporter DmeF [Kofleriaceae bacterium]|jgi:cation diffusion facilitator family transporter|nr:CDF family Co(II)/Ni(II) efflux transporter DmeF [Kofleriaceae bacterium]